jgi:hypothetical protein
MGRMSDILRTADRRPAPDDTAAPTPAEPATNSADLDDADDETTIHDTEVEPGTPPIEDDDDVPFIEVGGPREPALRLIPSPAPTNDDGPNERPGSLGKTLLLGPNPAARTGTTGQDPPGLFTIRFQPVHAARLGSRAPVAELVAFHQPDHPVSVQYRSLAAEIARQLPGTLPRVLLFAGSAGGVGTSTVVLNLAMTLARQESRVMVADAHLAHPALAARLGLPSGPGLREVLAGHMPPAWVLQETAHPNLVVLPAGVAGTRRDGAEFNAIVSLLRDRSDCVLIDAGPWSDAAADLAASCDAVYLVMREEAIGTPAGTELQEEVLERTGRLRGCVLTQR